MKKLIFSGHEKHPVNRLSDTFWRRSSCSATLLINCLGVTITSDAKLPIYQKSSMAHRVTRQLRLLRQLKCFLTALRNHQQVSELYLYDALNLLSCMTLDVKDIQFIVLHHKDKLFTVLNYSRNFENAAKEGLKRTAHWAPCYFRNPNSWYPVLERATIPSAISAIQPLLPVLMVPQSKHLLQQCVSALSDRKQRWQELELPRCTSIREKFKRANRSAWNALTSRSSKKTAGNKTKKKIRVRFPE